MIDASDASKVLLSEAEWLEGVLSNARNLMEIRGVMVGKVSDEYLRGFEAAIGWVKFHGDDPQLLSGRDFS